MTCRQFLVISLASVLVSSALHAKTYDVWDEIEAVTEKPFQEVIGSCAETKDDLANLNSRLERYGWTLTRYTVQLLHELNADSLPQASERLIDDSYSSVALRDAMWDGFNGWSIVSSLRPETLEVLQQLEAVRTGAANVTPVASSERRMLAEKAQRVTERLLKEAATSHVELNADRSPGEGAPAT